LEDPRDRGKSLFRDKKGLWRYRIGNYRAICKIEDDQSELRMISPFITRNGSGDLAVMSIELYDQLTSRQELYAAVDKGIDDELAGRTVPTDEALQRVRGKLSQ